MRSITRLAAAALAVATVAGAEQQRSAIPAKPDDKAILHVLNRTGFGARPGDVERVREEGIAAYIERQLRPHSIDDRDVDARLAALETLRMSPRELASGYFIPALDARRAANARPAPDTMTMDAPPARTPEEMQAARKARQVLVELSEQKVLRAAFSERQLEEVMVDFWFNHFNVFAGKGATMNHVTAYERDAIRPHVFGRFRDLLGATAKSPAMLFYLDNWQSAGPAARPGGQRAGLLTRGGQRRPQRGLNENYGRELMELHTLGVDGGYTQQDVVNVARAFTGWTIDQPRLGGGFRFDERLHDGGEKVVLGRTIKAGGGQSDGERVLDILASHPSTATFIATKLVRRFVADTPPPALVARAAGRFRDTGGDIREVVRTILTSPEFFAPPAYRAKVKTPFEFVVSAVRATGTDVFEAEPLVQAVRQLGMPLYMCQPPTGYADRADAWVNTGALLNRMNFALQLVSGRMRGVRPGSGAAGAALGGDVSAATAATIAKAADPRQTAALTLGSPEFQRR
ncbi:MAG TPA: DUF1800 domain-containing protein [Vicinamibacterales bacterium]|nr:DUF1800 domain-containing protein [Vicinamibacterales bacterium]